MLEGASAVLNALPAEFRADVVAVARKGDAPLRQIAVRGLASGCCQVG